MYHFWLQSNSVFAPIRFCTLHHTVAMRTDRRQQVLQSACATSVDNIKTSISLILYHKSQERKGKVKDTKDKRKKHGFPHVSAYTGTTTITVEDNG